jgi:hypothetical protein
MDFSANHGKYPQLYVPEYMYIHVDVNVYLHENEHEHEHEQVHEHYMNIYRNMYVREQVHVLGHMFMYVYILIHVDVEVIVQVDTTLAKQRNSEFCTRNTGEFREPSPYGIPRTFSLRNSVNFKTNSAGSSGGSFRSSGDSLVATPDCKTAVVGSNPAISLAYSGLLS